MSLKDVKVNFLVDVATELFMSQSIQDVTIKDIAVAAQVGEATIYRYFGKKQTLVLQAAMKLQKIVSSDYFRLEEKATGYQKLEAFYMSYLNIFEHHRDYYKFIREFDLYMRVQDDMDSLSSYENSLDQFKSDFKKAYEVGLKDNSLKPQEDVEMFYFTTTHALLELCKKLSMKEVLSQDKTIEKTAEIKCLINLILNSINNK